MAFNAIVSTQDLAEFYTPSFQSCVRDAKVGSVMCESDSALSPSKPLLRHCDPNYLRVSFVSFSCLTVSICTSPSVASLLIPTHSSSQE